MLGRYRSSNYAGRALPVLVAGVALLSACSVVLDGDRFLESGSDASAPDAGSRDAAVDASVDASPDAAADGGADAGADAGLDAGPDAGTDAGLPPPAAPLAWTLDPGIRIRDASRLGDGVILVGTTDPLPGVDREGLVIHYADDGTVRWAQSVGSTRGEQLSAVARDSAGNALIGGVTRSYPSTGVTRDRVLLVEATTDGVGRAWQWGTDDNDFLWALIPGGDLGAWVGLGYHRVADDRDGLVVVFDAAFSPLWAAAFDAGDQDEFFSGVVVGDTVYASGATGVPSGGNTRAMVAAITATEVRWARRSVGLNASGIFATVAPSGEIVVAGSVGPGRPALLRFSAAGALSGTDFGGLGSRLTRVAFDGDRTVVVGGQYDDPNFNILLATVGSSSPAIRLGSNIWTRGFLRTPMVTLDSGRRLVAEHSSTGFIDIPFSATPEAGCGESSTPPGSSSVVDADMPMFTLTREVLTFDGGEIAGGLPSLDVTPTVATVVCE